MAWIESHQTLREHPKVYVLVDSLGVSKAQVIGHLHLLWWWCVDYALDGVISQNDVAIARAAEWSGDPKQFVAALIGSQFLDRVDGVLTIHDWLEYCGTLVVKRLERQSKKKMDAEREPKTSARAPTEPNRTEPYRTLKVIDSKRIGKPRVNGNDASQDLETLERAVAFSGDEGSRAFYQKAIRTIGPGLVEEAVAEVRMRHSAGAVHDKAKYLARLLSDWMESRCVSKPSR